VRAEDLDKVERLFEEALQLEPNQRRSHLDRACAGDPGLRDRVLALLEADAQAATADLPSPTAWLPVDAHAAGSVVGDRFRLVRPIGAGGLGVVWEARQIAPVQRHVAVKFIRHDFDGRHVFLRFARERAALSRMDHPGIARIFDAGQERDGRPWFAMELVNGQPITLHCDQAELDIPGRVALLAEVCLAVHHAHQKGIIHRDLKPSNILVGTVDGRAVPKVIDFGIAKAVASDGDTSHSITAVTRLGQFVGTPAYMAPEQLVGDGPPVDIRCDIFALGVVLHELLAGCLPHDRTSRHAAGLVLTPGATPGGATRSPSSSLRRLTSAEIAVVAAGRRETPRSLRHRIRGELDWIVGRAIAEEPARRYASASELSEDLRRWLRHEPVAAGPPGAGYRLRKFAQRHTTSVVAAALVLLALLLGLAGTTMGLLRAREAERRQRELIAAAERSSYKSQIAAIDAGLGQNDAATVRRLLEATDPARRGWEWDWLGRRADQSDMVIEVGGGEAWGVAFTPGGSEILVTSQDGSLRSFDASTGEPRARIDLGISGAFWLSISSRGDRVCVGSHSRVEVTRYEYHLLEWPSGRVVASGVGRALQGAIAPDGSLVAVSDAQVPRIRLLDAEDGEPVRVIDLPQNLPPVWARFSSRRQELGFWSEAYDEVGVIGVDDDTMQRWKVPIVRMGRFEPERRLWLGVDGTGDGRVVRADGAGSSMVMRCRVPQAMLHALWSVGDGTIVAASSSGGGALQVHDIAADRPLGVLSGHLSRIIGLATSPDGRMLATVGGDGALRTWSLPVAGDRFTARCIDPSWRLGAVIARDGSRLASGGWGNVQMWRSADGALEWTQDLGSRYVERLAFSPDERRLAIAEANARVLILSAEDGSIERELPPIEAGHTALAWDGLDRWIVLGGADGSIRRISTSTSAEEGATAIFNGPLSALALSQDSALFAAGSGAALIAGDNWGRHVSTTPAPPEIVLGRLADGAILARLAAGQGVSALCFSPSGEHLFAGRDDGAVLVVDVSALLEAFRVSRPGDAPDLGSAVAQCVPPSRSATTPEPAGAQGVPWHQITSLACTPDGSRLLIGQRAGAVLVALPDEDGFLLRIAVDGMVHAMAISPGDGALVVACAEPFLRLESQRAAPELVEARERVRAVRAAVDPIVAEERILDRVLARIDASIGDASLRQAARLHAEARGENHALMVSQAVERARESLLDRVAHQRALDWLEHVRAIRRSSNGVDDGRFNPIIAALHLRLGRPDRTIELLEPQLSEAGGVEAIEDLSVPAILALAHLSADLAADRPALADGRRGDAARAAALMAAVERRVEAGEPLRGEAVWYVPEAREALLAAATRSR